MSIRLKPLLWQALVCVATAMTAALLYLLFSASNLDEWTAPILGAHPVPARATVVVAGAVFDGSVSQQTRTRTGLAHDHTSERSANHSRGDTSIGGAALEEPYDLSPIGGLPSAEVYAYGVDTNDGRPQVGEGLNQSPPPNPEPKPSEESPPATEPGGDSSSLSEAPVAPAESVDEPVSSGPRPEPFPAAEPVPVQPDQSDGDAHETEDHGSAYSSERSDPPGDGGVLGTTTDDSLGESGDPTDLHSLFEQKLGKKRGKLHPPGINLKRLRERFKVSDRPEILSVSSALRDSRADRWPLTNADAEPIDDDDAVTDDGERESESDDRDRVDEPADGSDEHPAADSEDEFDDTHGLKRDDEDDEDS